MKIITSSKFRMKQYFLIHILHKFLENEILLNIAGNILTKAFGLGEGSVFFLIWILYSPYGDL
jgi:hypothetical protein